MIRPWTLLLLQYVIIVLVCAAFGAFITAHVNQSVLSALGL